MTVVQCMDCFAWNEVGDQFCHLYTCHRCGGLTRRTPRGGTYWENVRYYLDKFEECRLLDASEKPR